MARTVQELIISEYFQDWHGKSQTVQVFKAWWSADMEITECEKLDQKNKYRIRLSNGEYKVIEAHAVIYLETY